MNLYDFLYGHYTAEPWLVRLIKTPIIQRLRWIALSNVPSLTYPTISGVSRYSHSLGVSKLGCILADGLGFSAEEKRTLACAGLLHDAGMPPLGHLTEEALDLLGIDFDHEESLRIILLDEGRRFSQMPDGLKVGVNAALEKAHVDSQQVFAAVKGEGVLGQYLAAKIDIDNIDNVIRLYRLIFENDLGYHPADLAIKYFSGQPEFNAAASLWESVRIKLYTKLMFSIEDFAQKATIKRLVHSYIVEKRKEKADSELIDHIRFLNDSQFFSEIIETMSTKGQAVSFYSGKYDNLISYGWVDSASKQELKGIRKIFNEAGNSIYFDFIPDKRTKIPESSNRGALVGLFSFERVTRKVEDEAVSLLMHHLPHFRRGFVPSEDTDESQLSLI